MDARASFYEVDLGESAPPFSDESLALRFAEEHADSLRYVAAWSRWLQWDGQRWKFDDTLHAFDLARRICREAADGCEKEGIAKTVASAKTTAAVVSLARADRKIAATIHQWDADVWSLNTSDGVIDLKTGTRRNHKSTDYMTKIAAVSPEGDCPLWLKFLDTVTAGDQELQSFLQRVAGYSLTGATKEHAMFFAYGTGANGKSVFVNTISGILGDYQHTAPIETFTATNSDRHPTELAGLRGARLVTATETEEGRRWAESKIKTLTGGDSVSARFMRQDFFEFTPQFKLLIAGNHRPGLRSVDEAIRRRFNLIPFVITIPPDERDPDLAEKLKAEWPGVLSWMVRGCLEWQRIGLAPPAAVTAATAAYLEAEDATAAWLDECCTRDVEAWEQTSTLFASWTVWAERTGEYVGTRRRFTQALEARGLVPQRHMNGRGFVGLRITQTDAPIDTPRDQEDDPILCEQFMRQWKSP